MKHTRLALRFGEIHHILIMSRPVMCLFTAMIAIIGYFGIHKAPSFVLLLVGLSQYLLVAAVFLFNDLFDINRDKSSTAFKPLAAQLIQPHLVLIIACLSMLLGAYAAISVSSTHFLFYIGQTILAIPFYSAIKRRCALLANILTAALFCSSLWFGQIPSFSSGIPQISVSVFLFLFGREILKDVYDLKSDSMAGIRTLPSVTGKQPALFICSSLLAAGGVTLLMVSSRYSVYYALLTAYATLLTTLLVVISIMAKCNIASVLKISTIPMLLGLATIFFLM